MTPWDPSRYPEDWVDTVDAVAERSGGACEWCGAENHRPHPKTGSNVVLTTAHVYDRRPQATGLDNLAHLCQRCHLRHDRAMHHRPPGAKATGIGVQHLLNGQPAHRTQRPNKEAVR